MLIFHFCPPSCARLFLGVSTFVALGNVTRAAATTSTVRSVGQSTWAIRVKASETFGVYYCPTSIDGRRDGRATAT